MVLGTDREEDRQVDGDGGGAVESICWASGLLSDRSGPLVSMDLALLARCEDMWCLKLEAVSDRGRGIIN